MEPLGTGSLEMVVKFRLWGGLGPSSASQALMQLCWAREAVEGEEGIDRSGLLKAFGGFTKLSAEQGRTVKLRIRTSSCSTYSCHCIVLLFWFSQSI